MWCPSIEKPAEPAIIRHIPKRVLGYPRFHYTQTDTVCTEKTMLILGNPGWHFLSLCREIRVLTSVLRAQRSSVQICAEGQQPLRKQYLRDFGFLSGICDKQIPLIFLPGCPGWQFESDRPEILATPLGPPDSLPRWFKFQFIELITPSPFSCFGKKRAKRSRPKGRYGQMRPLRYPPPHRQNYNAKSEENCTVKYYV